MTPLTIDDDGWFTAATDGEKLQNDPPRLPEKPQEETRATPYGQLGSRPSTGPARKRDIAAGRTPSGWIMAVDNINHENNASSTEEKDIDQAPSTSFALASTRRSCDPKQTAPSSNLADASVALPSEERKELLYVKDSLSNDTKISTPSRQRRATVTSDKTETGRVDVTALKVEIKKTLILPEHVPLPPGDGSSLPPSPVNTRTKGNRQPSDTSDGWTTNSNQSDKSTNTTPTSIESADTASITSTASTSASSSVVAGTNSSTSDTPKKLRPRARSSPQPIPTLGIDPKILVGKVLTHIRRSPDHPTVTLSFADGTTYQILVDGYDPRNSSPVKTDTVSTSRSCVLEMDEALLRMLEVPGRHVVDRAITDCAHIRLADKAYERREWEHSWQQHHVAVAFKFAEESRWHCVWAMRAEYDDRGCIFRTFDDVYLHVLERQPPRSPQRSPQRSPHRKKTTASPLKSPGRVDTSGLSRYQPSLKPPPSPTEMRMSKTAPKTPRKNGLRRDESFKEP